MNAHKPLAIAVLAAALLIPHGSSPTTAAEPEAGKNETEMVVGEIVVDDASPRPKRDKLEDLIEAYLDEAKPETINKKIVVRKAKRLLEIWINDRLITTYKADLGGSPVPDKIRRGDNATPEGVFYVARKLPRSTFYKALLFSYPDKQDAERGLKAKLISKNQRDAIVNAIDACRVPPQNTRLGGALEIHGYGGSGEDWTLGCVAIANEPMLEVFNWAEVGCRKVRGKRVPKTLIVIAP